MPPGSWLGPIMWHMPIFGDTYQLLVGPGGKMHESYNSNGKLRQNKVW